MNGQATIAKERAPEEPAAKPPSVELAFIVNLLVILIFGVGLSGWILYYTDWFPVVGGLLTLGGLFSWFAFVGKIVPEEVVKGLQVKAYRLVFSSWITLLVMVVIYGAALYFINSMGTVELKLAPGVEAAQVSIKRESDSSITMVDTAAGGSTRLLYNTSASSPERFTIKVIGYPEKLVELHPRQRQEVFIPRSLYQRVVFVKPGIMMMDDLQENSEGFTLRIEVTSKDDTSAPVIAEIKNYAGNAFWLGCEKDVVLPPDYVAKLRAELEMVNRAVYEPKWLYPEAVPFPRQIHLQGHETVIMTIVNKNGEKYAEHKFGVEEMSKWNEFIQEVRFDRRSE